MPVELLTDVTRTAGATGQEAGGQGGVNECEYEEEAQAIIDEIKVFSSSILMPNTAWTIGHILFYYIPRTLRFLKCSIEIFVLLLFLYID